MEQHRAQRVSESVREELAEIVAFEMEDPRLGVVEVTEVRVAPDLRHAHVLVALHGGQQEQEAAMAALDHARHYLRHELARRLNLRKVPELHFEADHLESNQRVEVLLKRAKKKSGQAENQP